jgi:hypothetical protein
MLIAVERSQSQPQPVDLIRSGSNQYIGFAWVVHLMCNPRLLLRLRRQWTAVLARQSQLGIRILRMPASAAAKAASALSGDAYVMRQRPKGLVS